MPSRINKKNSIRGKMGLPRFFWVMLSNSRGQSVPLEEIMKLTVYETDSKMELIEYLAANKFPIEIINLFMLKL